MNPSILVFAGSNRTGAFSGKLADTAAKALLQHGADVTRISLIDYPLPLMDEDLEREQGIPEHALKLARMFVQHDGLFIATPEYNGSIPPLLKNAIDWVSRVSRDGERPLRPYAGKVAAIGSSSTGAFAGIRAIGHLRAILAHIGVQVVSEQCSVANAQTAFDEMDRLRDDRSQAILEKSVRSLVEIAAMRAGVR
ncbi:MAG: NADPH-dependent FMN reductase [Rhizobiaceae bacterium]